MYPPVEWQNDLKLQQNGVVPHKSLTKKAPAIKDVTGTSLQYIGTYKQLDNKKQVVALIDDVSGYHSIRNISVSFNVEYRMSFIICEP